MQRKLFIVFEGIDGSGKSTQAEFLENYFWQKGEKAVLSPEPSSGILGNLIRQTLKKRVFFTNNNQRFEEQMAYLFASDRHDHLYNEIDGVFKLIGDGFHVLTTRYYFSSLAYNCFTEEQFAFVSRLNQDFPDPDLTIYIDIPVETFLARNQNKSVKEIYETQEKLATVRRKYQDIFTAYNGLLLQIDGTQDKNLIHQQIVYFINNNFI